MMRRSKREELSFEDALEAEADRLASEAKVELEAGTTRFRIGTGERRKHYHHRHHSYFARGLYADQLERWLAHFSREQLLVLPVEDLAARRAETLRNVLDFLGVRPLELPGDTVGQPGLLRADARRDPGRGSKAATRSRTRASSSCSGGTSNGRRKARRHRRRPATAVTKVSPQ